MRYWFISRLWWIGFLWYGLTRRLLRRGAVPVRPCLSYSEVTERVHHGERYKADRPAFDVMRHPGVFQARVDAGSPLGDCDDHGGYWAAVIAKSGLVWRVHLGMVHGPLGRAASGHLFAAWQNDHGDWWAADYSARGPFPTFREAAEEIARGVGMVPRVAAWVRVTLEDGDRLAHHWLGSDSGSVEWPKSDL